MSDPDTSAPTGDKPTHSAEGLSLEVHKYVVEAVQRRRVGGLKRAVTEVARFYGLGESRVMQYLRNKVRVPPAHEYLAIREKARLDFEAWARRSDAEAAELRRRLADWPP